MERLRKQLRFERSIDAQLLHDRLIRTEIGDTVTYEELGKLLGRPVAGGCGKLQFVVRALEREGIIFACVRLVGYRRLTDVQIVGTVDGERARLRRRARRVVRRVTSVQDFEALPNELKVRHNAGVSMFGAIAHILAPTRLKRLEQAVEKAEAQLPLHKTMQAFIG